MSTAPALRRLEPVQSAVAELAADIGLLLRRGRVGVAMKQLEKLPELVRDEITDRLGAASWAGYCRGFEAGRAALAAEIMGAKPKRPKKPTNAEWLRERLADPVLRERAKATLRLNDELLDAIAEGGVGLGSSSWRRLRRELGPAPPPSTGRWTPRWLSGWPRTAIKVAGREPWCPATAAAEKIVTM